MKANFALSLSYEGIRLLRRATDGWTAVGEVDLGVENLASELASLRASALDHEPGGIRSKLIIPEDQIKYLSIETGDVSEIDRRIAARKALDGATPYAVEDLSFDVAADGSTTHVAAVARETLNEAEGFAVQHGFEPISFVAIPKDESFSGEPYFGPSGHAASLLGEGEKVQADDIAIVEVEAEEPEPTDFLSLEEIENAPDIGDEPPQEAEADAEEEPLVLDAPDAEGEVEAVEDTPPPEPGFSSRRRNSELGGVTRDGIAPAPADMPAQSVTTGSLPQEDPGFDAVGEDPEQVRARFNPLPDVAEDTDTSSETAEIAPVAAAASPAEDETARMTTFGAREQAVRGKPRFLGLMLTVVLLVFLVGVAAWARVYFEDEISRIFTPRAAPSNDFVVTDEELQPEPDVSNESGFVSDADVRAALEDSLSEDPVEEPTDLAETPKEQPYTEEAARRYYARTGIWAVPPDVPPAPEIAQLDDLYVASIDGKSANFDAVALHKSSEFEIDASLRAPVNPQPPEVRFAFDEQGLVIPTAQGAISPEGYRVYAGKPPVFPTSVPDRIAEAPVLADDVSLALAAVRPISRPEGLVENTERQNLGGLSRSELAKLRPPSVRPDAPVIAAVEEPAAPDTTNNTDIERALAATLRPEERPRNFQRIVARATPRQPATEAPAQAETQVAAVKPRTVKPSIPSRTSVTKQATVRNAINLNRINLLGVSGKPASRSALVRLSNGRIKKVKVGDRIDGGRVSAIGDGELRYKKGSRNIVLKMPKT